MTDTVASESLYAALVSSGAAVSSESLYAAMITAGAYVTEQTAYVAIVPGNRAMVASQTAYLAMTLAPATGRKRRTTVIVS